MSIGVGIPDRAFDVGEPAGGGISPVSQMKKSSTLPPGQRTIPVCNGRTKACTAGSVSSTGESGDAMLPPLKFGARGV